MPKQNRVTPFGELIVTESRGTLMGNRGCLHDDQHRIRRAFANKRWLICVLQFRGRRRTVMAPGRYTELFFLDEATALAAGHRPCAECQHARYRLFREVWAAANPDIAPSLPTADDLDRALHAERIAPGGAKRTYREVLSRLPVGTMVADEADRPFLVLERALAPWQPGGYGADIPQPNDAEFRILTSKSIVRALSAGYPVAIQPIGVPSRDGLPKLTKARSDRMRSAMARTIRSWFDPAHNIVLRKGGNGAHMFRT